MPTIEQATVTAVAHFPEGYFLENLAVRGDGSVLVTAMTTEELWHVRAPAGATLPVEPVLVHTFEKMTLFVVESEPDVFIVGTADVYDTGEAEPHRIDLRAWRPGQPVEPTLLLRFPQPHVGLNGGCMVAPGVLLAAGAANLVWRVDLRADGASASVSMQHGGALQRRLGARGDRCRADRLLHDRWRHGIVMPPSCRPGSRPAP